jgi:hypothetical protein
MFCKSIVAIRCQSSTPAHFRNVGKRNQSGTVQFQFAPNSVCPTLATLSMDISAQCPPPPLSREATIGVVGATLGSLVLMSY